MTGYDSRPDTWEHITRVRWLLDEAIHSLQTENARLREYEKALKTLLTTVDEQAEDEALWALYPWGEQPIAEAYLQQELRRLHAVAERAVLALRVSGEDG